MTIDSEVMAPLITYGGVVIPRSRRVYLTGVPWCAYPRTAHELAVHGRLAPI